MKKILLTPLKSLSLIIIFLFLFSLKLPNFVYAGCDPPNDYSDCPELRPDLNLDVLTYEPITGYLGLNNFWGGETDRKAPQLSTLVAGNTTPAVTSLYQLRYWDWANNQPGPFVPRPPNLGSEYDFATLVGFSTRPGQGILVPNSGYNIGDGNEVMVLFATEDSLTLKYTGDDNVLVGYTLYLKNIKVDPQLLAYYNKLNEAGRIELPVLMAGMKIGVALGEEILVAIRDTGSFMDPRWILAWWQFLDPAILLELLLMAFPAGSGFTPPSLFCNPEDGGTYDSRPVPCDPCNQASNFCSSCATSFTVHDTVEYERGDGTKEEPYCVEEKWGGIVEINLNDTTIPFVGYKGEGVTDKSDYEQKYLADYFEGTNEYYMNYEQYWLDWINHAGVVRKLTPMEYQNKLKKEMVKRAVDTKARNVHEGGIHDYNLNYIGRLCWDAPFWMEALVEVAGYLNLPVEQIRNLTNYCIFEDSDRHPEQFALIQIYKSIPFFNIPLVSDRYFKGVTGTLTDLAGHFPPSPDEEDYVEKWNEWKKSGDGEWYKLWVVTPLMSRDDTRGDIFPYLGRKSKDIFDITNPDTLIEKVPHVARLYEATQKVNEMLVPSWDESLKFAQKKNQPIIASAKENVLGEKTERKLLAQGEPPASVSLVLMPQGCLLKPLVEVGICSGGGNAYHYVGDCGITMANIFTIPCGSGCVRGDPQCPSIDLSSLAEGQTTVSCVHIEMIEVENCQGIRNATVCCEVTKTGPECGDYESDCTIGPSEGVCGISDPMPVLDCEMPAITDPNDNDKICGEYPNCGGDSAIRIDLTAWDAFENWEKPKCEAEGITCKSIPDCIPTATNDCQICKDPCEEIITKEVNRRIGINLSHPYLTKIWEQTGLVDFNGLFNIFRPAEIPEFREIDAASEISYSYHGGVTPPEGRFYYNYLGGVQLAKEWVVETLIPQKDDKNLLEWILGL